MICLDPNFTQRDPVILELWKKVTRPVKYWNLPTKMIFSQLLSVFLSFVIAAVIHISFGMANGTIETGSSPNTTTTKAISVHPPVVTSTMSTDLVTSSLLNRENISNAETAHKTIIGLPDSTTLLRTFYVLLAVTAIIIVYFVVRTVRLVRFRSCFS